MQIARVTARALALQTSCSILAWEHPRLGSAVGEWLRSGARLVADADGRCSTESSVDQYRAPKGRLGVAGSVSGRMRKGFEEGLRLLRPDATQN